MRVEHFKGALRLHDLLSPFLTSSDTRVILEALSRVRGILAVNLWLHGPVRVIVVPIVPVVADSLGFDDL